MPWLEFFRGSLMRHTCLLNAIGGQRRNWNFASARPIALFNLNVDLTRGVLTIIESSAIYFGTAGLSKLSLAPDHSRKIMAMNIKHMLGSKLTKVSSNHLFLLIRPFQGTPGGCSFPLCLHSKALNLYLPIFISWETKVSFIRFQVGRHEDCV